MVVAATTWCTPRLGKPDVRASVDGLTFRRVMSAVCSPVAVVTALDDGRPYGTTVSSFMSLSLEPPMVVIALDVNSGLLRCVQETQAFGVNILGSSQDRLAKQFARKGVAKLDGVRWVFDDGLPRLPDAAGWISCSALELVPGGDHSLVLGHVHRAADNAEVAPLTYHRRAFGTHCVQER